MNEIKFQDNNHHGTEREEWSDLEWIEEFSRFLQGDIPEGIHLGHGRTIRLSEKKAQTIIWYLQEHMRILPDHIERCDSCGDLFDSWNEGYHIESKGKTYCGGCDHLHPVRFDVMD